MMLAERFPGPGRERIDARMEGQWGRGGSASFSFGFGEVRNMSWRQRP